MVTRKIEMIKLDVGHFSVAKGTVFFLFLILVTRPFVPMLLGTFAAINFNKKDCKEFVERFFL